MNLIARAGFSILCAALTICFFSHCASKPKEPQDEAAASRDEISAVVSAHLGDVRMCYENELKKNPKLQGKADFGWTIDTNGATKDVTLIESSLMNKKVEKCIIDHIKTWKFATRSGITKVQKYPFRFAPSKPPANSQAKQ